VSYVGTVPNAELARSFARWLVPAPLSARIATDASSSVTIHSGQNAAGRRVIFVHNWSGEAGRLCTADLFVDLSDGARCEANAELTLEPWGARVLAADN
jgi:beta-galactosidase